MKTNWGMIIATGIAAFLLIMAAGYLFNQLSSAYEVLTATDTPHPSTTPILPAYAIQVPHEGRWIALGEGGGTERGTAIPTDTRMTFVDFYVAVTYPTFDDQETATTLLAYSSLEAYTRALEQTYYAIYDASNRVMSIQTEVSPSLDIYGWQPTSEAVTPHPTYSR
jgi:hypothetical protein